MCSFWLFEFDRNVRNSSPWMSLFWSDIRHPAPLIMTTATNIFSHQFNFKTVVTILCVVFDYLNWSGMREIHTSEYRNVWTGIRYLAPPIMTPGTNIFAHQFIFKTVVTILCVVLGYLNWSGMQEIHACEYRYFWTGIRHLAPRIMTPASCIFTHQFIFKTVITTLCVALVIWIWPACEKFKPVNVAIFGPASGTNYDPGNKHICSSIHFQNCCNYPMCSF